MRCVRAGGLTVVAALLAVQPARGDDSAQAYGPPPASAHRAQGREAVVDRVAVRYWSPETGGPAQPRFFDDRSLAFEARLAAMAERPEGLGAGYQERHVRDGAGPRDRGGDAGQPRAQAPRRAAAGQAADRGPARAHPERAWSRPRSSASGVARASTRPRRPRGSTPPTWTPSCGGQALAAWYIDRAVTPVLEPSDEQLREVFRTSAHPFRGQAFDSVRTQFAQWLVADLVRAAEGAFLQAARSRVKVVVTR